ncbi:hypothetical protein HYU82_02390 [Candidatus Saccharibacteria bacterium]|nr:hypothetical protein [Candidatus Saccharibacteria bacterium]
MNPIESTIRNTLILTVSAWRQRVVGLLIGNAFVWLPVLVYQNLSYYQVFLSDWTQRTLIYLAISYSLYALFFYSLASPARIETTHSRLSFIALKKIGLGIWNFVIFGPKDYTHRLVVLNKFEKRALLFGAVKFFFVPMMLNFLYSNYNAFSGQLAGLDSLSVLFTIEGFNSLLFPLLFTLFILIDVVFFAFGYLFEAGFLANRVRSVEPTVIGWAVALICYPPFNTMFIGYTNWYASDYPNASSSTLTFILRLLVLVFMGIYASASVALGPKASNLTNRGIVDYGPYRFVRHPAYTFKNLAWWVSIIPIFSPAAFFSMFIWSFIYFMRAITEERHLMRDPDYQTYCKKVQYRFIPKVV